MFDEIIENSKSEMLNTLSNLISFPSISIENENSEYPFGKSCNDVLEYTLNLAKEMGFRVKNIDSYCGYIEFGKGTELVGIIGHLDVVPANLEDGWSTPPFEATIKDGKLYGRGSIDDKGPVVASLYAMKAIMDNSKLSKRVRLILGLNEEKSWKCIKRYKETEEWPTIGFSPDADFPGIYAEKGILSIKLKTKFSLKDYSIVQISTNNNAINVVPKYCSITLKPNTNVLSTIKKSDNIEISVLDNNLIKIEAFGKASHAAHPEDGKNAIEILVNYLINNFDIENTELKDLIELGLFSNTSPQFLSPNINQIIEDESGILTSNVAIAEYDTNLNNIIFKINLRVPVKTELNNIFNKYLILKNKINSLEVNEISRQDPLFVDKNSYLVKTLVSIFNEKVKMKEKPIAIGGGTYARAFDNVISFGAVMPGEKEMCHQVNEYIDINNLILSSKIYADAIYKLAK